jgi:glycosyltransferase involved in cell wall biosynthesis
MSISYIIPYYNIPIQLLDRCIASIINIGNDADWNIIIIDDGTPDSQALALLRKYQDPRICYHRITHTGLGGARNEGIKLAQTEYIQFIDSDDYIFAEEELKLIKIIEEKQPDAVTFEYKKVYKTEISQTPDTQGNIIYEGEPSSYMAEHDIPPSSCRYIIKKSAIGRLEFTPNRLHEDEEFSTLLFLNIKNIIITNYCPYAYYQRQGSIINSYDKELIKKRFSDLQAIIEKIQSISNNLPHNGYHRLMLERKIAILAMCLIINLIRDAFNSDLISNELQHLKNIRLYPLPSKSYGIRYHIIRLLTIHPYFIKVANVIFRGLKNT